MTARRVEAHAFDEETRRRMAAARAKIEESVRQRVEALEDGDRITERDLRVTVLPVRGPS